ncbi:hypothetical protein [Pseudomonas sp. RL_5y_Pfl2_69]|uniref:hypothetical protein n=1 Tax=Pseudomonas sp. RL_5y_Pfl2_69 TaxID=3088711 RepID=UPI0030DAE7EB
MTGSGNLVSVGVLQMTGMGPDQGATTMSHGFEGDEGNETLARELSISVDQVEQYVTLEANESDDGLLYGYTVRFEDSTPLDIRQAAGAGDGFTVDLGPNVFDEEE